MTKTLIIIPARMASTRFPGKPLVNIQGKTMIERVWESALKSKIGDVYVACCDPEVEEVLLKKKIKYIIFGIVYILAILILGAYFYKEGIGII